MEDFEATPPPLVTENMTPYPPNPVSEWIKDNEDTLRKLFSEANDLLFDNRGDYRLQHLTAIVTGLNGLLV